MKNLAIIPARSGSKGLKDKNIRLLNNKPLMAYSIEAAFESELFDTVHVSTDSIEYQNIAQQYSADVPFLRSEELASDTATTWDAVRYVLNEYEKMGKYFDMVTVLQPTSPLRTGVDIKKAYEIYKEKNAKAVVSVCQMDHSPLWSNVLPKDGCMKGFLDKAANIPRQQIPVYYRINGAIYMVDTDVVINKKEIYGEESYSYIMEKETSVDIDDIMDFKMAEFMMINDK